ncbi:hypothetical protein TNCV_2426201 [Trichonephila clavipes]|nr:hypothetical protein TNCV_2426201 [Trichonephila clavipes]
MICMLSEPPTNGSGFTLALTNLVNGAITHDNNCFNSRPQLSESNHLALSHAPEQLKKFGTFPNDWPIQSEVSFSQHENFHSTSTSICQIGNGGPQAAHMLNSSTLDRMQVKYYKSRR